MKIKLFIAAIVIAVSYWVFRVGGGIPFAEQWPQVESLREISSIIFGVFGAWIALIYPGKLEEIFKREKKEDRKNDVVAIERLLLPMRFTTVILFFLLLFGLFGPFLKQFPWAVANAFYFRGLSFLLLSVLSILQIVAIVMALFPAGLISQEIRQVEADLNRSEALRSKVQKATQTDMENPG